MRPFRTPTFTPAAANATGFATNVTGASWTLTATTAADGLAHQITIHNNSATDHSAKTARLVGTNADGAVQTETLNLPGPTATVTSTKFFLTLTSVTPSATIGADTMNIGWAATAVGPTFPVDGRSNAAAMVAVHISGTINFAVDETMDNIFQVAADSVFWSSSVPSGTADVSTSLTQSAQAFRVRVNSLTAGATWQAHCAQGGNIGA